MLEELRISNFRIFDDEVTVRFRPITVLIGRNSAGKSSVIKFLLMLQQSLGPGNPQFLTPEGDKVHLGIFPALRNSLTRKRKLQFELKVKGDSSPGYALWSYLSNNFKDVDFNKLLHTLNATVSYNSRVGQTGKTIYSLVDSGPSGTTFIERSKKISNDSVPADFSDELYRAIRLKLEETNLSKKTRRPVRTESQEKVLAEFECLDTLRYQIKSLRHLSPVREESQRVILASPPPTGDVGQRGQYALPHLQRIIDEDKTRYEFISSYMKNVAGIEQIQFKKSSGYLSQCLAKNHTTGAAVPIADYGFGVSQCLPIFVQGAIMPPKTSFMIEQPEAQLHPTAQLELGSFFADLWKQHQVGSIIETHSDNILLRLRRLIAAGKLFPNEVSVAYFTSDEDNGNMPIIKNLDINKDGSMPHDLPMEFFGKNLEEVLSMGAGE